MSEKINLEIYEKVRSSILEVMEVEEEQITPDTHFLEDLEANSLDLVTLIMSLEEQYSQQIEDDEFRELTTVRKVVDYIENNFEQNS